MRAGGSIRGPTHIGRRGRVYRLDLELYDGLDRVYKVAYFNDSRPRSVERCNRTFDA